MQWQATREEEQDVRVATRKAHHIKPNAEVENAKVTDAGRIAVDNSSSDITSANRG